MLVLIVAAALTTYIVDRSVWKDHDRFLNVTFRRATADQCKDIRTSLDYIGQIDQDLQAFLANGIDEAALDEALNNMNRAVMVHIRDNMIFVKFKKNSEHQMYLNPRGLARWRGQLAVLLKASCFVKLPDIDFAMYLPDKIPDNFPSHRPFFHFQKKQNGTGILLPYASHTADMGEFRKAIENEKKYEWEEKESKLFWRGSTTGGHYNRTNWDSFPRSKLVLACAQQQDLNETCDAAFIGFVQVDTEDKVILKQKFSLKSPISMEDHMKYKYIAWLDGNGACSGRSEKLVSGNSLLFKQESEHIEFYYSALKPYSHYVSIKADMSDLADQLAWARSHDDEAKKIVSQMRNFSHQLSPESIACYIQGVLERYASLLIYDLKPLAELHDARPVLPGSDFGGTCRNPIYACKEYMLVRNKSVDTHQALLGEKEKVSERCLHFFPMFKSQLKDYWKQRQQEPSRSASSM